MRVANPDINAITDASPDHKTSNEIGKYRPNRSLAIVQFVLVRRHLPPDLSNIAVARDPHQSSSVASKLVDSINGVFSLIAIQSAVSSSTSGQTTSVKGGVFAGDSMVRDINQKILDAATMPINGHSPSEYGISVTRSGTISYDPDKFAAALAADPATVTAAVQQIATRVAAVATQASDKYTGTITAAITGEQSQVRTLGTQVAAWDLRLAARKATLQSTYSAMEVRLSNLKAQSASLMSQLGSLSSSSTGH